MGGSPEDAANAPSTSRPRTVQRLPSGFRVLQVNVPQRTFELAKAKALMVGKPWPQFVVGLLEEVVADLKTSGPSSASASPAT